MTLAENRGADWATDELMINNIETFRKKSLYKKWGKPTESMETANEMSKNISKFTNSNYGVGITGKLNRVDRFNPYGLDNVVYISIYDKDNNKYYNSIVEAKLSTRKDNKELVINEVITLLDNILNIK